MNRVAQDGMRVQANAGRSSFRRGETLRKCQVHAKAQVAILRKLIDEDAQALSQREDRIRRAIRNYEDLQGRRKKRSKTAGKPAKVARASTTDPDSRLRAPLSLTKVPQPTLRGKIRSFVMAVEIASRPRRMPGTGNGLETV